MKKAVLTGASGFLGNYVLNELSINSVFTYAVVRSDSARISRVNEGKYIKPVWLDIKNINSLENYIGDKIDVFYHLAWSGGRDDYNEQLKNIDYTVSAVYTAKKLGAGQFIVTGSQAELGIYDDTADEEHICNPDTAYGVCKLACYEILRALCKKLDIKLTWARVFSVYGEGDNPDTLISYLKRCFKNRETPELTSGIQTWNFLHASDAARALYLLFEKGKGGLYNIAHTENKPLKEFVIEARDVLAPDSELNFANETQKGVVRLWPNIDRIIRELNWKPQIEFREGINY